LSPPFILRIGLISHTSRWTTFWGEDQGAKGGSEGVVLSLHNPFYIEEDRSKGVVEMCRCKVSLDIVVDIEVEKWKYSTNGSRWVALYT
jgi:hypothetical protein